MVTALAPGGLAAYALVLALPRQPWVLSAADGHAHYTMITAPAGLLLAALVDPAVQAPPAAAAPGAIPSRA